jgi:2-oxoglutarate ferredoxin oxidoreductase subunit gamma
MRTEVRLAGFGGQGIIRAGLMLAMASSIYDNKNAVQTQSYGPESRGGSCKSEVVISDEEVDYPRVVEPDVLVTMSQEAFTTYAKTLKPGGTLLIDPDMVHLPSVYVKRIVEVDRPVIDVTIEKAPETTVHLSLGKEKVRRFAGV